MMKSVLDQLLESVLNKVWNIHAHCEMEELWLAVKKDMRFSQALNQYHKVNPYYTPKHVFKQYCIDRMRQLMRLVGDIWTDASGNKVRVRRWISYPGALPKGRRIFVPTSALTIGETRLVQATKRRTARGAKLEAKAWDCAVLELEQSKAPTLGPVYQAAMQRFAQVP